MVRSIQQFWKDESGLSTLEYIVGAGVMVLLALFVFTGVFKPEIEGTAGKVGQAIEEAGTEATR